CNSFIIIFFFSSRRRHTSSKRDWSSDVCSSDLYVVFESDKDPKFLLLATGSEVNLAIEAAKDLEGQGKGVRVVSMPNWHAFDQKSDQYKASILPSSITKRIAIEMASSLGWHKYVGTEGKVIGIDGFGASAPGDLVVEKYGFTKENVLNQIQSF